jgi:hypothetical protein
LRRGGGPYICSAAHIPIYTLKHEPTPFAGLAVTPDGKHLLFAELMTAESNITLVEHYK